MKFISKFGALTVALVFLMAVGLGVTWKNPVPYRAYNAILAQSGTSAPTATVLQQSIQGHAPIWAHSSKGVYTMTFDSATAPIKANKVQMIFTPGNGRYGNVIGTRTNDSVWTITALDSINSLADSVINNGNIELRQYP